MRWSFQLARIAGIDVRVHVTFFLLLAWFAWAYYSEGGWGAMVVGLSFIILLFVCVVLHEFGHALAARAYGIRTPDITLLPIGGVARLERMPEKPWQEFVVAIAGPAVNVVIALGLYVVLGRFISAADMADVGGGGGNLLSKLLAINVILVAFNLLPAFPMDGGRILRALLSTRLKRGQATRIAAGVGQAMAVIFGLLGLFGNPMLLFIAVFVFFGAQQEAAYATAKEHAEETRVSEVMEPMPPLLHPGMTVLEAVRSAMRDSRPIYPVVDADLRLTGLVPAVSLAQALDAGSVSLGLRTLMVPAAPTLLSDASLAQAWAACAAAPWPAVPVVNRTGQLVGMVGRERLAAALGGAG